MKPLTPIHNVSQCIFYAVDEPKLMCFFLLFSFRELKNPAISANSKTKLSEGIMLLKWLTVSVKKW